jgi:alpha-L-fucosidase
MNRRDLLKFASVISTVPLLSSWSNEFSKLNNNNRQTSTNQIPRFGDGRDWFFEKRYGMFVHWGLYSIPGWHEQHQWRGKVERNEYVKLAERWNPEHFNPEQWLDLMEEAGMKYITITTKHHDGFCLWDTKQTTFNTMNTPFKKDVIGMLADACHKRGIPLCLYYSIADWNHPNYPNEGRHHELPPQPQDSPDWAKYMHFLKEQVRELCTNYGEIHGFWWDMNVPVYNDKSVNVMIRQLQPKAVINNRGFDEGDFGTPERDYDKNSDEVKGFERMTEACQSVGMESWGYKKDEDYYTDRHLIASIDKYLARDANYLLNVGPTGEGLIPPQSAEIIKRIGIWKKSVDESFNNVEFNSGLTDAEGVLITYRDKTLYVHLNNLPVGNGIKLKPITVAPQKATLLNTGEMVDFSVNLCPSDHASQQPYLRLRNLPVDEMSNSVMVVKLEFDRPMNEITKTENNDRDTEMEK